MGEVSPHSLLAIGSVLDERYELLSLIGKGGYGLVYEACQISTGQHVAIKVLLESRTDDPDKAPILMARFEREMRLIAQLKHPNIVRLIDSGRLPNGQLFTVMEFIEGQTLAEILFHEGALSLRETKHLMIQVLDALSVAHHAGIVHRDLKPDNIMVTTSGVRRNAMVLDFGIAAILEDARDQSYASLTATGHLQGTPSYMAPEQLRNKILTPQSDLFAWGLIFFECLTGNILVTADSVASIIFIMMSPNPITIPDHLQAHPLTPILAKAIQKPLDQRYASARDILLALEDYERATTVEPAIQSRPGALPAPPVAALDPASQAHDTSEEDILPDPPLTDTHDDDVPTDEAILPPMTHAAPSPAPPNPYDEAMTIVERRPSWVAHLKPPTPDDSAPPAPPVADVHPALLRLAQDTRGAEPAIHDKTTIRAQTLDSDAIRAARPAKPSRTLPWPWIIATCALVVVIALMVLL